MTLFCEACAMGESCPAHDPSEYSPPGEPTAAHLERELADLVVIDGPNAGQVWVYVADEGGFMRRDGGDGTVCNEAAAVIDYVGGNVRPLPNREDN